MRIGTSLTDRLGFIAFAILAAVLAVLAFTRLTGSSQDSALELATAAEEPTPAPTTQPLAKPEPTATPTATPTSVPTVLPTATETPVVEQADNAGEELDEDLDDLGDLADTEEPTDTAAKSPTQAPAPTAPAQATATPVALPTVVPPAQQPANTGGPKPLPTAVVTPAAGAGPSTADSERIAAKAGTPVSQGPSGAPVTTSGPAPAATDPGPVSGTIPSQGAPATGGPAPSAPGGQIRVPPAAPRGGSFTHTLTARVARPTLYRSPGGQTFMPTFNGTALPAYNPTVFGRPLVYRVLAGTPTDGTGWAQVYVPARPNGTTAWVKTSEFTWGQSNHLVRINITNRTVTVFNGNQQILTTSAVLGKSSSPTPVASGWVEEVIPGPNAAYGPTLISLGVYSDSLNSFGGRVPKIAMHGTNRPDLIGQYASNGCIRIENSMIQQIASIVPVGSKVEIVR